MNKKICVFLLIIVLIVLGIYFGINAKNKGSRLMVDDNVLNNNESESNTELSKLPLDYTIADAIEDGCVTIEQNGNLNNQDKLDLFFDNAINGISGKVRIVEEYGEKNIAITDASFDEENLSISYDYSRSSEPNDEIITNTFSLKEYYLLKEAEKLEGGNSVMLYKIVNNEKKEDVYYLTGYTIFDEEINTEQSNISGEI